MNTTPTLIPVTDSSAVKGYAYDPATKVLHVQHNVGGPLYPFYEVPQEVVTDFIAAESMGRFLGQHIRGKYPSKPADAEA